MREIIVFLHLYWKKKERREVGQQNDENRKLIENQETKGN